MADGVKIKVRGLDLHLKKLRRVAPNLDQEMDAALGKSAQEVVEVAAATAPKRSGDYAKSINAKRIEGGVATFENRNWKGGRRNAVDADGFRRRVKVTKRAISATMSWGIFADWIYTFIEFGTSKAGAQPHLFPAFRMLQKRIHGRTRRAMSKAIKAAFRK